MDSMKLDLNLLATLEALLAERNVTRAARKLGLSQPAVSAQLARLRDLLGDQLAGPGAPRHDADCTCPGTAAAVAPGACRGARRGLSGWIL